MVIERRQAGEDRSGVRSHGQRRGVKPYERGNVLNTVRRQDNVDCLADHFLGSVQRGARRKLNDGDQVALILLRNETGRRARKLQAGDTDECDVDDENNSQSANETEGEISVPQRQPVKATVKAIETRMKQTLCGAGARGIMRLLRLEERCAKGRAEGQRNEAGNDRRRGDRNRELTKEQTGDTTQESRRDEDGAQRQCNREQRPAHFVHGPVGGFRRGHAGAHIAFDVFDYDDRIIDHNADRQH